MLKNKLKILKSLYKNDIDSFKKNIYMEVLRKEVEQVSTSFGTLNSQNRYNWIKKNIEQIPAESSILDAGAGEKQYAHLCKHLKYTSQDFSQYTGTGNGQGLQTGTWEVSDIDIVSDITAIPVPDHSFDAVMCTEVLEHIPNSLVALNELTRILRPKGLLLLTAPFCSLTHFAPYFYTTGFSKYFYEFHLPQLGYEIIEIEKNGNYFEYIAQEVLRVQQHLNEHSPPTKEQSLIIQYFLQLLEQKSSTEQGSLNDLLCFGYHIKAVKK